MQIVIPAPEEVKVWLVSIIQLGVGITLQKIVVYSPYLFNWSYDSVLPT